MDMERLEALATKLAENYSTFELDTVEYVAEKLRVIGNMSPAELKMFNNIAEAKRDTEKLYRQLAKASKKSVSEVKKLYGEALGQIHEGKKELYDYRGKPFIPLQDNEALQAIIEAYARTSAGTLINITQTKAIGFTSAKGFASLESTLYDVLGNATLSAASGGTTFRASVINAIERLGGSGVRVQYDTISRRLDTVVRQNVLWGVKQAADEYERIVGEELGCDGIEIDFHSFSRPSHLFMQGKQYSIKGNRLVGGKLYRDAEAAGVTGERGALNDYGCKHFASYIICGVSEPAYTDEELEEFNERERQTFDVDGKEKGGYDYTQVMRRLETEIRKERVTIAGLKKAKASKDAIDKHEDRVLKYQKKHQQIADALGEKVEHERMEIRVAKS